MGDLREISVAGRWCARGKSVYLACLRLWRRLVRTVVKDCFASENKIPMITRRYRKRGEGGSGNIVKSFDEFLRRLYGEGRNNGCV